LGIILAMAGLDYTHVREPDYDPQALIQSREQWEGIKKTVGLLRQVWEHRDAFFAQLYPDLKDTYTREKQIFYDTDGIREFQQETVRVCDDCPGWLRIDSRARGGPVSGQRMWAMSIPLLACARCAEEARAQYHDVVKNPGEPYDWIYLQDRPADAYYRYDLASEQEQILS
jgi:hypothetical protein